MLFGKLALPVIRKTKTGASTDADTLEELAALHPVPAKIVEYRALAKLKGTYIDALPALVEPGDGAAAHVVQPGGGGDRAAVVERSQPAEHPHPQRAGPAHPRARSWPSPGHVIVSADYSQIELRILAHFSEDPAFLDAFRTGQDIHLRTAAEVFGVPPSRSPPSTGASPRRSTSAWCSGRPTSACPRCCGSRARRRAQYIDSYFARYVGVRRYMERAIAEARATRARSRRCWAAGGRCPRSARRARRTAATASAWRATRRSRARPPTC